MEVLLNKIEILIKKNRDFGKKIKALVKIDTVAKNRSFAKKWIFWQKRSFGKKSTFWQKTEIMNLGSLSVIFRN